MKTATLSIQAQTTTLQNIHLIVNGNIHRPDLCKPETIETDGIQIHEALLPQIRTVATLIAAMRHDFSERSPDIFTEEADWFAARIIVLGVKCFYLDITMTPMLKLANQRAQAFADSRRLPFTPATIRMSLHANRPNNLLIVETEHHIPNFGNIITNSIVFKKHLMDF